MPRLDTARVLEKIVEVHHRLRYVTSVDGAMRTFLPTMSDPLGFGSAMLKLRDEDDMFRGYTFLRTGEVAASIKATGVNRYRHFISKAQRISNSYFASHEINVWGVLSGTHGWERVYDDPDWQPGQWHPLDSLLVPVSDKKGDLTAVLWADQPVDKQIPDESVIRVLELFAEQAVAAIEIRRLLERNQKAAITDGLTRLHTHRHFQECLEREVAEARRHNDWVSLLMIDLDHFKRINDHYGHPVGDQVLRQTSEIFQSVSRTTDHVARYGGEEFAVILPRTSIEDAWMAAERYARGIKENWESDLPRVTISVGVASYPRDARDKASLVESADRALLQAKRLGRNRICYYEPEQKASNA